MTACCAGLLRALGALAPTVSQPPASSRSAAELPERRGEGGGDSAGRWRRGGAAAAGAGEAAEAEATAVAAGRGGEGGATAAAAAAARSSDASSGRKCSCSKKSGWSLLARRHILSKWDWAPGERGGAASAAARGAALRAPALPSKSQASMFHSSSSAGEGDQDAPEACVCCSMRATTPLPRLRAWPLAALASRDSRARARRCAEARERARNMLGGGKKGVERRFSHP